MASEKEISVTYKLKDEVSKPLSNVKTSILDTAVAFATGQVAADAMQKVFSKLVGFLGDSISAYDDAILAQTQLKTALGYTSQALLEQQNALMQKTRFDDDAIAKAQSLLAMQGLTEKQILKVTPAILDYAAATGSDLNSAFEKVGRTIGTHMNALKREGIEIDDSSSKNERLTQVIDRLNGKYADQAEAMAKVGTGPLVLMKNNLSNFMETVGEAITQSSAWGGAINKVSTSFANLAVMMDLANNPDKRITAGKSVDWLNARATEIDDRLKVNYAKMKTRLDEHMQDYLTDRITADKHELDVIKNHLAEVAKIEGIKAAGEGKGDTIGDKAAERKRKAAEAQRAEEKEFAESLKNNRAWNEAVGRSRKQYLDNKAKFDEEGAKEDEKYWKMIEEHIKHNQEIEKEAIEKNQRYADQMTDIWTQMGGAMAAGIGKGSEGLKESMKAVLNTALSFAEKYIITMEAAQLASGWWNPAVWAQIALTTAAFESAKAGVGSFQTMPGQTRTVPGGPNQMVPIYAHGGEQIGRPSVTNNNNNGVTLNIHAGAQINNASAQQIVRKLDELAKDGHFNRSYNLKAALANG